jgi:hypothetical protein
MLRSFRVSLLTGALALALLTPAGVAFQTTDPPGKNGAPSGPSDKAIAAAKAHGLVWVPKKHKGLLQEWRPVRQRPRGVHARSGSAEGR